MERLLVHSPIAAAREAGDAGFDVLVACAFNYDARSAEFDKLGRIPVLKARMNADLHMADETLKLWIRRKRGNRKMECSGCGRKFSELYDTSERAVRDLPWSAFTATVYIEIYRVKARTVV